MKNNNIIEFKNVTKEFLGGKIVANDDVTFGVKEGSIHAIAGENGAGKSTLLSMLFGLYKPTKGHILVRGEEINYKSAKDAMKAGLGMVQQHFQLVDVFNVVESVTLGIEKTTLGFIKKAEAAKKIDELSKKYNFNLKSSYKIKNLSVGQKQRVEILKLLFNDSEIMIFDEPTAMLTPQEIEELIQIILELKKQGKTIIIITHKLDEIKALADEVSVLRKGKYIGTIASKDVTPKKLSEMMVGRNVEGVKLPKGNFGEVKLKVSDLKLKVNNEDEFFPIWMRYISRRKHLVEQFLLRKVSKKEYKEFVEQFKTRKTNAFKRRAEAGKQDLVNFEIKAGEILSIAGVEGNGQVELAAALSGLTHIRHGKMELNGKDVTKFSVNKKNWERIAHIPEDRHKYGMFLDMKIYENMAMKTFRKKYSFFGIVKDRKMRKDAREILEKFDVRGANKGNAMARGLSGGNQQKAVIARELSSDPEFVIVFQATRGLDVGAIQFVHEQIIKARSEGKAILLISYDLNEIMALSDRIAVINKGQIVETFERKDATRNKIGQLMTGKIVRKASKGKEK